MDSVTQIYQSDFTCIWFYSSVFNHNNGIYHITMSPEYILYSLDRSTDPNLPGRVLWSYPVTVSDFVLRSHDNWGAGLPKPDSGPAPDSLRMGLSPKTHPKVHGRVLWANPSTIRPFLGVPHYYWDVGRPEWVSGSIPTTAP